MANLSLEFISIFGLPPAEFVSLAADLGCQHITTVLEPIDYNPEGYPHYSLRNATQRREVIAALKGSGITISQGEGMAIAPGVDVRDTCPADLEAFAELGVPRVNAVAFDPDPGRCFDQLAILAEIAAPFGIATMVEFVPIFTISSLSMAIEAVRHVGRSDCKLIIDTMHVARTGTAITDLAAVDPALIGYIQLCDAPLVPTIPDYLEEAMFERMVPGDGELPLFDMLSVLPKDVIVGLEVPRRSEAEAGIGPHARMARCVAAGRKLLAEVEARTLSRAG